ncbi:MAG: hypothetical protein QXW97_03995 [Candidatus Pacearchaeota archaeon]
MRRIKIKKKGFSISFEWIFAIVVGSIILFLAIYGISTIIRGGEEFRGKETAEKIKSYLDPFETGLASGESTEIKFRIESKIYLENCNYLDNNPWGFQTIAFSEKTFGNKFSRKSEPAYIKNKYVFGEKEITGKKLYIFSKPFFMGFKVADLIIMGNERYCFYKAPREIEDELNLQIEYINFSDDIEECSGKNVCFNVNNPNCDIYVYGECNENCDSIYDYGRVIKKNSNSKEEMFYINNLWIAAIFSSSELYECNVQRLMKKFSELGNVYIEKIKILQLKGCDSDVENKLFSAINLAKILKNSKELPMIHKEISKFKNANQAVNTDCQLF